MDKTLNTSQALNYAPLISSNATIRLLKIHPSDDYNASDLAPCCIARVENPIIEIYRILTDGILRSLASCKPC